MVEGLPCSGIGNIDQGINNPGEAGMSASGGYGDAGAASGCRSLLIAFEDRFARGPECYAQPANMGNSSFLFLINWI